MLAAAACLVSCALTGDADVAQTYLRRIRDLDAPSQPGDRPEVVDIKVQVTGRAGRQAVLTVLTVFA